MPDFIFDLDGIRLTILFLYRDVMLFWREKICHRLLIEFRFVLEYFLIAYASRYGSSILYQSRKNFDGNNARTYRNFNI